MRREGEIVGNERWGNHLSYRRMRKKLFLFRMLKNAQIRGTPASAEAATRRQAKS